MTDIQKKEDETEQSQLDALRMHNALRGGSLEEMGNAMEALLVTPDLGIAAEELERLGAKR